MWQEELRERRKDLILEAAAAVFAEKGYQRATVKEVATRAGIAAGTIYLYFENKRDLLLGITDQIIGQALDEILAQMAHADAETYVAAILQSLLRFVQQNQALLQALVTEIWTDEELQERFFAQVVGPIFDTGARYLQVLVEEGKARPCRPEIIVPAALGSMIVLSALRTQAADYVMAGVSDEELIEELTRLYTFGLGPDTKELME